MKNARIGFDKRACMDFKDCPKIKRIEQIKRLTDWCIHRVSNLSLDENNQGAQALTDEFYELLTEQHQASQVLWMKIEKL